jgi:hypothetical protein
MWLDKEKFEDADEILEEMELTQAVGRILGPGPYALALESELPELRDLPLTVNEWSDGESALYRVAVEGRLAAMLVGPVRALVVREATLEGGVH